jgi:hypothetical protein
MRKQTAQTWTWKPLSQTSGIGAGGTGIISWGFLLSATYVLSGTVLGDHNDHFTLVAIHRVLLDVMWARELDTVAGN